MIYVASDSLDACYHFGREYYFAAEKQMPDDVFLFWRTVPTLMLGRYQNLAEEIRQEYADAHGVKLVRRLSGGGTIYTDPGGFQFSFITRGDGEEICFDRYLPPVLGALRALGIPAVADGRNDVTVEGRKVSGNAQYKLGGATVHHGSLLFRSDLDAMTAATCVDAEKIFSKSIKSVRERVTNLGDYLPPSMTAEEFRRRMVEGILRESEAAGGKTGRYTLTAEDEERVQALATLHFRRPEVLYGKNPAFAQEKSGRFSGGKISCRLTVREGRIQSAVFRGDFFASCSEEELSRAVEGCLFEKAAVKERLAARFGGISPIRGVSLEELAGLLI